MRRILIDKRINNFAKKYGQDPFSKRRSNFIKPLLKLEELKVLLNSYPQHQLYIDKIIAEYSDLNCLKPSEFDNKELEFDNILQKNHFNTPVLLLEQDENGDQINKEYIFSNLIIDAMRYEDLREKDFFLVLKFIGVKSCIYCNAQLTIVSDKNESNSKSYARLELDHFYPKSIYPYLCTNFYNLFPACGSCNRIKSQRNARFNLYTDNINDIEVLKFELTESSVVKYLTSRNIDDISFKPITHPNAIDDIVAEHDEMFCIQGIYDTQKDIIEELIHKKEAYTEAYKKHLVDDFKGLFPDQAIINRLLVGNYDKPEDIHKRPMSKFMQDIARDLHLIK